MPGVVREAGWYLALACGSTAVSMGFTFIGDIA